MELSKNLYLLKAQDIQKCIHRCARYPKIYPPICEISKNISTKAQDMQCSVQILAPSDAKSSSPSTPGQRGWSLAGGGNIYSFDANDGEQYNNRSDRFILISRQLLSKGVCLFFRFGFAREKVVNYCQNMFTCFPSRPDSGGLEVEMWLKLVNSVSPNPRFASSTKMKTGFKIVQ